MLRPAPRWAPRRPRRALPAASASQLPRQSVRPPHVGPPGSQPLGGSSAWTPHPGLCWAPRAEPGCWRCGHRPGVWGSSSDPHPRAAVRGGGRQVVLGERRLATGGRLPGRGAMACSRPELRPFPHIFCKTFSAGISHLADKSDSTFAKVMVQVLPTIRVFADRQSGSFGRGHLRGSLAMTVLPAEMAQVPGDVSRRSDAPRLAASSPPPSGCFASPTSLT